MVKVGGGGGGGSELHFGPSVHYITWGDFEIKSLLGSVLEMTNKVPWNCFLFTQPLCWQERHSV